MKGRRQSTRISGARAAGSHEEERWLLFKEPLGGCRARRSVSGWASSPDRLSCWPTTAELAGWVRHDRPHMAASERGQALPHSVTLSNRGWELMRIKKKNWHQALIPSAGPSHMPNGGSVLGVLEFGKVLEGVLGRAR
jgi:hypothetical protein